MRLKLSDPSVLDVELEDVDVLDYLYFVDDQEKVVFRLRMGVLLEWIEQEGEFGGGGGGAPEAHAASHATDGADPITPASIGAATTAENAAAANAAAAAAQAADDAAALAVGAQGTADNAVTAAGIAQTTADDAATAASTHSARTDNPHSTTAAQVGALPAPGGTTTANGIAYGTGTTGAAVAISTTTIADLVKRLGNVHLLSANTVLDDSYSGGVIFTDTSGGARSHTIPTTVSAGWNAIFVREGANTLNVIGDGTMLMAGPAAAANAVAIAVDNGGVSVIRRSAAKCWCAGVIS